MQDLRGHDVSGTATATDGDKTVAEFESALRSFQNFFGDAVGAGFGRDGIHLSGIVEIDPAFEGFIEDFKGGFLIALRTKGHGSHADLRDD